MVSKDSLFSRMMRMVCSQHRRMAPSTPAHGLSLGSPRSCADRHFGWARTTNPTSAPYNNSVILHHTPGRRHSTNNVKFCVARHAACFGVSTGDAHPVDHVPCQAEWDHFGGVEEAPLLERYAKVNVDDVGRALVDEDVGAVSVAQPYDVACNGSTSAHQL